MMKKKGNHYPLLIIICLIGVGALLAGKYIAGNISNNRKEISDTQKEVLDTQKEVLDTQNEVSGTQNKLQTGNQEPEDTAVSLQQGRDEQEMPEEGDSLINADGNTLETRIRTPEGYTRISDDAGSLAAFLRTYNMKKDGSKVRLYDGKNKGNQSAHAAIFRLPIENVDLQQCADSVMRIYAEYYWHINQKDRIAFHFVNGFLAEYSKWQQGYRIDVSGNDCSWVKSATEDASYECFQKYLQMVFSYASTLSMEQESHEIKLEELQAGDVFIRGGSPGHVVMVVDVCENAEGQRAFLLAQGYMPAQEFHVLKNPAHEDDPWYYVREVTYPFHTPEYVFDEGSLRRLEY